MDYRVFTPCVRFMGDVALAMVKDDQRDLAFPTRPHKGMFHHFHWGLGLFSLASLATELIDVYEIIKKERYNRTDTPGTFLQRVIAIHDKTYVQPDNIESQDRVSLLQQYFDQLRQERGKRNIERKVENAIYMGKIKTKNQLNEELRKRRKKSMRPPRPPQPRAASQGKIMLYRK